MEKLYLARHKVYDMYWGRKCGYDMWTNDISAAILLTKEQWKDFMAADSDMQNFIVLSERRYNCSD